MHCKSYSHFFSKKFQHIRVSLDVNFNDTLTNDIVSFQQLGPENYPIIIINYFPTQVLCTQKTFFVIFAPKYVLMKKKEKKKKKKTNLNNNSVFWENRGPHPPPSPLHHELKFFYHENSVKVNRNKSVLCYVPIIYSWKFGKNQNPGSYDVVQTRKCYAMPMRSTPKTVCPRPLIMGTGCGITIVTITFYFIRSYLLAPVNFFDAKTK